MTAQIGVVRQTRKLLQAGSVFGSLPPPPSFDPATIAWVNAVVAAGGTVSGTQEGNVDTLIKGLKSDGNFSLFDRIWLHAAENSTQALIDLVHDAQATLVGSPTFTTNRGFNGDASGTPTDYINSGYQESTGGNVIGQNSSHYSSWLVTLHVNDNGFLIGVNSSSDESGMNVNDAGGQMLGYATDGTSHVTFTYSTAVGHWLVTRSGSAANSSTLYQNGSSVATGGGTSAALSSINVYILAFNNNGTVNNGIGSVSGLTTIGAGMTSAQASAVYNRFRTYMTAVGVP